jgi:excisionase family DNA binding protein
MNMDPDFITLQEAADYIGKSPQTVRRMIKKGDVHAHQMKLPQGFRYVLKKSELLPFRDFQKDDYSEEPFMAAVKSTLTSQNEQVTSQPSPASFDEREAHHSEKMFLIALIERLQKDLDYERKRPKSLLGYLMDWLVG